MKTKGLCFSIKSGKLLKHNEKGDKDVQTFITINGENGVIMTPDVSNGYGVIIAGGSTGYVSENSSDFHNDDVKRGLLEHLVAQGYTIGYCNHTEKKHWGNPASIRNIQCLHQILVEHFHVNPYIHLFGVSMGGVTCLNLLASKNIPVMSTMLVNPVLDLSAHRTYIIEQEGADRIGHEIAAAYDIPYEQIDSWFADHTVINKSLFSCPCLVTHGGNDHLVSWRNNALLFTKLSLNSQLSVQLRIVKEASHNDPKLLGDYTRIREFFQQNEPKKTLFPPVSATYLYPKIANS